MAEKFPRSRLQINALQFLMWGATMTPAQIGKVMERVAMAAQMGDESVLAEYPWVKKYVRGGMKRGTIPADIRARVLAAGCCAECGSTHRLEVDHIQPVARGGSDDESNLQALCRRCNLRKGCSYAG